MAGRSLREQQADYGKALEAARARLQRARLDPSRLEVHRPLLERLDSVEGSSVVVYDISLGRYVFLTSSFRFLMGSSREEALAQGPEYFYGRMHPDDLPIVLDTVTRTLGFLAAVVPPARREYRLSFDFRIRRADEVMVRLVQQVVVLEQDTRGNIWMILAVNDLVRGGSVDAPATRSLVHLKSGTRHLFEAQARPERPGAGGEGQGGVVLSPREIEILGLVAVGLPSREIADRLFLSVATVNNHRQHILEKMEARNSAEAVRFAAARGLV